MKKVLVVLFALGLAFGASAQRGHVIVTGHGGGYYYNPRVVVGIGAYSPFGYFYNPYYPYAPYYRYGSRPSKLDMQIADIKNDYKDKIWSARHADNLTRKERRLKVHQLKHERDQVILDTKKNYYKH